MGEGLIKKKHLKCVSPGQLTGDSRFSSVWNTGTVISEHAAVGSSSPPSYVLSRCHTANCALEMGGT